MCCYYLYNISRPGLVREAYSDVCPSHEEIVLYAEASDALDEYRYIRIREHIKACPTCRYKVRWCMEDDESDHQ